MEYLTLLNYIHTISYQYITKIKALKATKAFFFIVI
jgi:hypothetical protein